ncbi:MAG: hypothetical protein ACYTEP_11710 [Planctomycetota bacterium]|jgi:regulator of replication initiation timing
MPNIPQEIIDKFNTMQTAIDALGTKVQQLEAQSKFTITLETLLNTANQDANGVVDENAVDQLRLKILETMIKLAGSKLQVYVLSQQGHALDNVHWATNKGDGDRTIQFQDFDPTNDHLKMRLQLV